MRSAAVSSTRGRPATSPHSQMPYFERGDRDQRGKRAGSHFVEVARGTAVVSSTEVAVMVGRGGGGMLAFAQLETSHALSIGFTVTKSPPSSALH